MSPLKLAAILASLGTVALALVVLDSSPKAEHRSHHPEVERRAGPRPPSPNTPSSSRRAESNSAELADLRHQVRQLTLESEQAPAESPTAEYDEVEPDAEPRTDELTIELTVEVFDETIATQAYDEAATRHAESHFAGVFDASGAGGQLLAMDCGDDLCRGQLAFDDLGQRDERLRDVGSLMPWDADGFFHSDPEDASRVSIYFSRAGKPLPSIDSGS